MRLGERIEKLEARAPSRVIAYETAAGAESAYAAMLEEVRDVPPAADLIGITAREAEARYLAMLV